MIFKKHLDSNKVSSEWTTLVYGESIFKRWLRHLNFSELRHSTIYVSLSNICLQYIFITWTNHVDEIFLVLSSLTVGFGISQIIGLRHFRYYGVSLPSLIIGFRFLQLPKGLRFVLSGFNSHICSWASPSRMKNKKWASAYKKQQRGFDTLNNLIPVCFSFGGFLLWAQPTNHKLCR